MNRQRILIGIVVLVLAVGGFLAYYFLKGPKTNLGPQYFPSSITTSQINIPVYYPVNLPSGFSVGSFKVIGHNILNYAVSSTKNGNFYITIEPIPANFDFSTFKQKFLQPDEYSTAAGDTLVGPVGSSLVGSIQTNQNDWIILNSSSIDAINTMETITHSFRQVSLPN